MKPKKYKVMIDIYKGVLNNQLIEFTTQDHGSNVLEFEILEDKVTPYNLDGCLVRMVINGQQQDCTITDATNGLVNITLHQSMFLEVGPVFAELQIYDALNQTIRLTTPIFRYTVKKSLMDDETVQADPNYSILQNMILEVSSADELAKQAKTIAEKSLETANQAKAKAQEIMANGDYAKEQGNYAKAEGDRLQGMLTLNGDAQTKFDFIENKVVQDGLVALPITIQDTEKNGVTVMCSFVYSGVPFELFNHLSDGNASGWNLTMNSDSTLRLGIIIASGTYTGFRGSKVLKNGEYYEIICLKNGTDYKVYINGILEIYRQTISVYSNIPYLTRDSSRFTNLLFYNRPITPQEIQHNLSTFNNSPSIKELRTTDSAVKTSILKIASDTDHVEDRSGRIQEQINRTFYKRMCKEIPSPNGEPVTVNNGEEGYVLSAEIKGQTVKNICKSLSNNITLSQYVWNKLGDIIGASPNTEYTVMLEMMGGSSQEVGKIQLCGTTYIYTNHNPQSNKYLIVKITTPEIITKATLEIQSSTANNPTISNYMVIDGKVLPQGYVQFGLSSTQAVISNNGEPYPIYANEEDKENKKVISCGGVGDVKDTFEILEDGSAIWTQNTKELIFDGSESWAEETSGIYRLSSTEYVFGKILNSEGKVRVKSNLYNGDTWSNGWVKDSIVFLHTGGALFVRDTKIANVQDFKSKLSTTNLIVRGSLGTPIIIHIPKELVPTVRTHKTNILEVGGKVKASSFKVTLPVDAIGELRAEINEIKKQLGAVAALQLGQIN